MKKVYITWHYTTHGIAYFKHILSRFFLEKQLPENINLEGIMQEKMHEQFNKKNQKGFLFDELIYLTAPQKSFDKLSSRRFNYKDTILKDNEIINHGLTDLYKQLIDANFYYDLKKEDAFVEENHPNFKNKFEETRWRNIQHYPIKEQIKWLQEKSNFNNYYSVKLKIHELNVKDFRDEEQIAKELLKWLTKYFEKNKDVAPIINVSLGSNETAVVWHVLANAGFLPNNTRFIKTYDNKNDKSDNRFKEFSIKEISLKLTSELSHSLGIFEKPVTSKRILVNNKIKFCIESGFSLLLLGERGVGKSRIAEEQKPGNFKKFISANCASFDDDSKAEAELFGYKKGAFTGPTIDHDGLMIKANGGILFLDEVHHLSKYVQAKLMKAIQTDKNNKMTIRKMGESDEGIKVELRLIFASNNSITELKKKLLPDFYDRIVQHVIEIPPLRETPDEIENEWKVVWKELFGKKLNKPAVPKEDKLISWIKNNPLFGNYRDLQKIAMYYNIYNEFDPETKNILKEEAGISNAFSYSKVEFEKYHNNAVTYESEKYNFNTTQTTKEMQADYLFELQKWAVEYYKGRKQAVKHFNELGDTVNESTFNKWKNKNSIK